MSRTGQVGIAVLAWALACWPLAEWYVRRLLGVPDQAWLALAPLTALALVAQRWHEPDWQPRSSGWWLSILLMMAYALLYPFLPMTLRAVPALGVLLFLPGPWRPHFLPEAPLVGLCLLGLPAVAMLQFYFGFPLQILSAALAVPVLEMAGLDVSREGAVLILQGQGVGVDAACSGIRMGWAGLFLAFALSGLFRLGWGRTIAVAFGSLVLVLAINAARVAALVGIKFFGWGGRPVMHAGVGVMLFLALASGIFFGVQRLGRRDA